MILVYQLIFLKECRKSLLLFEQFESHCSSWCFDVNRLEQNNERETVKMAQKVAASRRAQIAQERRDEERARKKTAYPNATRVFVNYSTFCCFILLC